MTAKAARRAVSARRPCAARVEGPCGLAAAAAIKTLVAGGRPGPITARPPFNVQHGSGAARQLQRQITLLRRPSSGATRRHALPHAESAASTACCWKRAASAFAAVGLRWWGGRCTRETSCSVHSACVRRQLRFAGADVVTPPPPPLLTEAPGAPPAGAAANSCRSINLCKKQQVYLWKACEILNVMRSPNTPVVESS